MAPSPLEGRVAIVTGASRGLGWEIAKGLHGAGAHVVLSSRGRPELEERVAELDARRPGGAHAVPAHAGRPDDLRTLVDQTMERLGRIDMLVNNAGTNPYFGPVIDVEPAAWRKTFEVNLEGCLLLTQLCWRAWMEEHGGSVLNVASVAGIQPAPGLGSYGVSKAAMIMLTRQLARELGGKVRVNAIAPGLFRTRFSRALWENETVLEQVLAHHPMGRIGEPEEVAGAAVFLLSDAASFVNGQVLVLDGGGETLG
ncbi:MAG TPA: SDR family oxidoreductase [Candidatus Dormibacteraeota bacterium]|jgi:NAD(P)-dependent dehydrogenase (short-subunit alcohol dehydrogenase family)|nr:SDR family oxidoreductase [Candidatus Dormibacteraeota bacterium]